ncbi:MAG TPA: acyl-CoA thioester hydrolase/BAAT C-terminal domain-containing protein [Verrucomicrobiae bacterium]|nr:acyl-CoA thioester hydrolase/BAAT C-terminal domain-containing protein [Verrucomicrobiae bacterium]
MRKIASKELAIASMAVVAIAISGAMRAHSGAPGAPPAALPGNCTDIAHPFAGTICVPRDDARKHPAMILLGGSEGGNSLRALAAVFAQKGYVAASVAYFGMPGLPPDLVDVPVETVGAALDALAKRPDVDSRRIGVFGDSRGGELALLAASTYPRIAAVVGDVPAPFASMGLGANDVPAGCPWSLNGKPLPCVPADPAANARIARAFLAHRQVALEPLYDASRLANPALTRAAFFHLERIHGPVLCLAGADDRMWNSSAQCSLALAYLKAHRHPYPDRAFDYPEAGHLFLFASSPQAALVSYRSAGATLLFGGTPQGDYAAARAGAKAMWSFLAAVLRGSQVAAAPRREDSRRSSTSNSVR